MIRATVAFEHAALRPLFILNGGALVVYLGVYGALAKSPAAIDLSVGKFAVVCWLTGLLLATLVAYLGARSQFAFRKLRGREVDRAEIDLGLSSKSATEAAEAIGRYGQEANCYRSAAILAGALSVASFMAGFWPAFASIHQV